MSTKLIQNKDYLLLIDEEVEIKENYFLLDNEYIYKGGADMANESAKKIVSYYPLTKEFKELDLPLLPNPFEGEGIERLALEWFVGCNKKDIIFDLGWMAIFEAGYKTAQSKQFSLEDMKKAYLLGSNYANAGYPANKDVEIEFKQLLSTQQLPKEFIPEYEQIPNFERSIGNIQENYKIKLKAIINSEGKEEIQGTYKY
jgi:hypothetical protein